MIDQGVLYGYATGSQIFVFLHYDPLDVETVYYYCQAVNANLLSDKNETGCDNNLLRETAVGLVATFLRIVVVLGDMKGRDWVEQMKETLPTWSVNNKRLIASFTPSPAAAQKKTKKRSDSLAFRGKARPSSSMFERATRSKTKVFSAGYNEKPILVGNRKRDDDESDKENNDGCQELHLPQLARP
jgi:hypothetical protein